MAIFAVISQPGDKRHKLPGVIAELYPESHYKLTESTWLIATVGSPEEVSDKMGFTSGENGSAVVLEVSDYYGRADNRIWAWVKNNWEATSNG